MNSNSNKSVHILNASTNLMGFSFLILTSLKVFNLSSNTLIDEFMAISVTVFVLSCLFSFFSIRSTTFEKSNFYERIADYIFLVGLLMLFCASMLLILFK